MSNTSTTIATISINVTMAAKINKNSINKVNILQLNINKSIQSASVLLKYCENNNIDILLIQEQNIKGGTVRGFPIKLK